MQSVNVTFPSSTNTTIAATIDFPDAAPKAFAVFAHCFAGNRHNPGASRVCKRLAAHGYAALRFDLPGLGQSEGSYADTSFTQHVADIQAAAAFLAREYCAPQLLIGHSLGGAASLAAASGIPSLKAVSTIGAPFDPAHSVHLYADSIADIDENGVMDVNVGGRTLPMSRAFLEDLANTDPVSYLAKLRVPLLILHSPTDTTVGIDSAQNIFRSTRYPKSLVALNNRIDHLLTKQGAAAAAADQIEHWAQQYLVPDNAPEETGPDTVVTHSSRGTRFGVVHTTNGSTFTGDKAKTNGGKGVGLSVEGLLLAALAQHTVQAAQEAGRNLPVEDIVVRMTHIHGATFERSIEVIGAELTAEEKAGIIAAAKNAELPAALSTAHILHKA